MIVHIDQFVDAKIKKIVFRTMDVCSRDTNSYLK